MTSPTHGNPLENEEPTHPVEKADVELGRALASRRNHPVIRWCCGIGEVGDQGPLYLLGASMVAAGIVRKSPRCVIAGVSLAAAVGAADLAKSSVKRLVKRSRPDQLLDKGNYRFEPGGSSGKEEQSFPSGHVAGTVAAAETLSRFYPAAAPYARSTAAVITLSRVVRGKHWPLDLVAGSLVGFISERVVRRLVPVVLLAVLPKALAWGKR